MHHKLKVREINSNRDYNIENQMISRDALIETLLSRQKSINGMAKHSDPSDQATLH
jgi:hypothetical protein